MTLLFVQKQADVLEAKKLPTIKKDRPVGGLRGVVSHFSKASRRRLIVKMERMELRKVRVTFVTLTFTACVSWDESRRALKMFLMRIRRQYPNTSGVWRLEHQERGAIHFHILFFKLPYIPQDELQKSWEECTREPRSIVDIRLIVNKKQAMHYVSKYIAKVADEKSLTSLDSAAYQHETGRRWGVINEKCLPYGKIHAEWLDVDDDVAGYFWWATRAISRGRAGFKHDMMLLFTDEGKSMLKHLKRLANRHGDPVKKDWIDMLQFRNSMTM